MNPVGRGLGGGAGPPRALFVTLSRFVDSQRYHNDRKFSLAPHTHKLKSVKVTRFRNHS